MPDTVIRRADSADLPQLLSLVAEFNAVDGHAYDESAASNALQPLLASDRYGIVWLIGEPVAGYAVTTWGYSLESAGVEALLDELYVRERGRGLGSEALQAILAKLRGLGIKRMFLETEQANTRARRFYARNGFDIEDSIWMSADL